MNADIDATSNYGRTPLFYAAGGGHTKIVDILVKFGAYLDAQDNDGMTPLHQVSPTYLPPPHHPLHTTLFTIPYVFFPM